jgi:hypothetical protein
VIRIAFLEYRSLFSTYGRDTGSSDLTGVSEPTHLALLKGGNLHALAAPTDRMASLFMVAGCDRAARAGSPRDVTGTTGPSLTCANGRTMKEP